MWYSIAAVIYLFILFIKLKEVSLPHEPVIENYLTQPRYLIILQT